MRRAIETILVAPSTSRVKWCTPRSRTLSGPSYSGCNSLREASVLTKKRGPDSTYLDTLATFFAWLTCRGGLIRLTAPLSRRNRPVGFMLDRPSRTRPLGILRFTPYTSSARLVANSRRLTVCGPSRTRNLRSGRVVFRHYSGLQHPVPSFEYYVTLRVVSSYLVAFEA